MQAPLRFGCIYALINSDNGPIDYDIGRGKFLLDHNTEYSIAIGNFHKTLKATVMIEIDGVVAGKFQLDPDSVNVYERPVQVNRKFTFVDRDSQLGREGQLHMKSVSDLGRGKLIIRQEIPSESSSNSNLMYGSDKECSYECADGGYECADGVGGTVLGNLSDMKYFPAPSFDSDEMCVFNFRMGLRPKVIPLVSSTCACCQHCPENNITKNIGRF
jgi:hypothetical protein